MEQTIMGPNGSGLNPALFQKCAPSIGTNVKQCGTVTTCNAIPAQVGDLSTMYESSGQYRVMEALFHFDIEIKQCEAVQNGLYEFFMANKVSVSHKVNTQRANSGLINIAPFILARQYSPINNAFWLVSNGQANGANWQVTVRSAGNIPPDVRSFIANERLYITGLTAGGTKTETAWIIISSTQVGSAIVLVLQDANSGSYLDPSHLLQPIQGVAVRGTANKSDYEKFCGEPPAYMNWKDVPFWVETDRTSFCSSELYEQWRSLLLADNELYRQYGDLDEIQRNKQLAMDWQRRQVDKMMKGKAISANQTEGAYNSLESINTYAGGIFDVGGAQCVGKRANLVGIYEQHAQCNRIVDVQGGTLNLLSVFNELYNMMRIREGQGKRVDQFDLFTDSITAEAINSAMIAYYNAKSQNTLRLTLDINQDVKKANFGFNYRSYNLFYPTVRINVVSHYYFDDLLAAATAAGISAAGRNLWVMDFSTIYPGIIDSNRIVQKTGDLKTLAAIDSSFACVMRVPTQTQTLTSVTMTMIVECPAGNLLIENFSATVPTTTGSNPPPYPTPTSTTTTTTTAPVTTTYQNTSQSYTATCPTGTTGSSQTVTIAANTYQSYISVADANAKALQAATEQAIALVETEGNCV